MEFEESIVWMLLRPGIRLPGTLSGQQISLRINIFRLRKHWLMYCLYKAESHIPHLMRLPQKSLSLPI